MRRAIFSIFVFFVFLLALSFTVVAPSDAQQRQPDECWTPGRPKPDVQIGLNGSPILCGRAISLPKPPYPEEAKKQKISGSVRVNIVIDENGRVIWAEAVEGHPLLREASAKAACNSKHSPTKFRGRDVTVASVITYNFASQ